MNNTEYATKFASRSFVLAVLAYASLAGAAPPERAADLRAAGVQMGPAVLYPSLGLHFGRDDNIFLQPSGEKSSNIIVLIPTLDFVAVNNGQRYGLLYQAEAGRYGDSSADDYTDQRLLAEADVGLGQRGRLDLQAEYLDEHDPRGTGASEGNPLLSDNPDVWHSTRLGATFKYGAPGARGRLDLALGAREKHYDNNRATTAARDLDQGDVGVTFLYRVAPLTSLLLQATDADIDYKTATLDSTERRYLAGVTWEATAKTSGTVKVGRQKKDFDDTARTDFSGGSWAAAVVWSPLTYSFFELSTNRRTEETNGTGNFDDKRDAALAWTHGWTSFLRTKLSALTTKDQYKGASGVILREDKTPAYRLNVSYQIRRWLNLGLDYTTTDRNSDNNAFDYKRNVYLLSITGSL